MAYKPKVLEVQAGGTGLSTIAAGSLIYASSTNTFSALSTPTNLWQVGTRLDFNGTEPTYFNFPQEMYYYDDFFCTATNNVLGNGWFASGGGGSSTVQTGDQTHPGVQQVLTGTSAFANIGIESGITCQTFGGGRVIITFLAKLERLSTAASRYNFTMGFGNNLAGIPTTGVYFQYQDNVNSGNYTLVANNASSTTTTNSSTPADTNWHKFTIDINAGATLATFYIDGASIGTVASNIPTSNLCAPQLHIENTGTPAVSSSFYIDAYCMYQLLTSAR